MFIEIKEESPYKPDTFHLRLKLGSALKELQIKANPIY
jgi:hypothetical protein